MKLPKTALQVSHVFHQFAIRAQYRDPLKKYLVDKGIGTLIHYPVPIHLQPAHKEKIATAPAGLPVTEAMAAEVLSIPMFPELTDAAVDYVIEKLNEWPAPFE